MSDEEAHLLLVGEIFVDFTVTAPGAENKLRLGGIVHAARGLWALNTKFRAAVILPDYLEDTARDYLKALGCVDFIVIGRVRGAPNVTVIFDAIELADQEYETLLRDEKTVELDLGKLVAVSCQDILVFPGSYNLEIVCKSLPSSAQLHIDVAYDLSDLRTLADLPQRIQTAFISTSSNLFTSVSGKSIFDLIKAFDVCSLTKLIIKENRGGTRIVNVNTKAIEALPAQLGITRNSVGVGDVFDAVYLAHNICCAAEAGWRATYAAAAYSQTTDPDLFKTYVQRDLKLSLAEMRQLHGVVLPWEERQKYPIYLAAPDFSYVDRREIDKAIASLGYHNFNVRRPVLENHELPPGASLSTLQKTYRADYGLLKQCAVLFAVPTGRDPGTLVEIGIAIEAKIPTVVYDPASENANTMVIAGANYYSTDLDECLNAVFRLLSKAHV